MLSRRVEIFRNPWPDTIPPERLTEILAHISTLRAEHVERHHSSGVYESNSLGIAFMDPMAPIMLPSEESLLATIAIGHDGEHYVLNAIAKAVIHRNHDRPAGYGVYVDLATSGDGEFGWGFSTRVDDLIAGASGQTQLQDAMEAGHAAVTLLYMIRNERKQRLSELMHDGEQPSWLGSPSHTYQLMKQRSLSGASIGD